LAGKITSITAPFSLQGWTAIGYDDLDRVTSVTLPAVEGDSEPWKTKPVTSTQTWAYDPVGLMTENSALGTYKYPSPGALRPHAVTTAGSLGAIAYDANGSALNKGTTTYTWDGANRLATATVGSTVSAFSYDATSSRVLAVSGSTTIAYPRSDYRVSGGVATKQISIGGVLVAERSGTTTRWLHTDHLGTVQALTDSSGDLVQRYASSPYGLRVDNLTLSATDSTAFVGQQLDSTGLVYFRARYYDPQLGQFVQADSASPTDPRVGMNRYQYAGNDPVDLRDNGHSMFPSLSGWVGNNLSVYSGYGERGTTSPYVDIAAYALETGVAIATLSAAPEVLAVVVGIATVNLVVHAASSAQPTNRALQVAKVATSVVDALANPEARAGRIAFNNFRNLGFYGAGQSLNGLPSGSGDDGSPQVVNLPGTSTSSSTDVGLNPDGTAGYCVGACSPADIQEAIGGDGMVHDEGNFGPDPSGGSADSTDTLSASTPTVTVPAYGGGGAGGGGGGCFPAGTPITMADGTKKDIVEIVAGDHVESYDVVTGSKVAGVVRHVFILHDRPLLQINGNLFATPNHPFFVEGEWVRADQLTLGDSLLENGGESRLSSGVGIGRVTSLVSIGGSATVYNLEVGTYHDFFAGDVLVHNSTDDESDDD
jgi:RHS repeat-associated protein